MKTFFSYSDIIYDTLLKADRIGIAYIPNFQVYKNYFVTHTILPEQQYRPDKISLYLYNTEKLDWVLDSINHFYSPKEYEINRTIKYLPIVHLQAMRII